MDYHFLEKLEKYTVMYRYLALSRIDKPLFLQRNLYYMRCPNSNKKCKTRRKITLNQLYLNKIKNNKYSNSDQEPTLSLFFEVADKGFSDSQLPQNFSFTLKIYLVNYSLVNKLSLNGHSVFKSMKCIINNLTGSNNQEVSTEHWQTTFLSTPNKNLISCFSPNGILSSGGDVNHGIQKNDQLNCSIQLADDTPESREGQFLMINGTTPKKILHCKCKKNSITFPHSLDTCGISPIKDGTFILSPSKISASWTNGCDDHHIINKKYKESLNSNFNNEFTPNNNNNNMKQKMVYVNTQAHLATVTVPLNNINIRPTSSQFFQQCFTVPVQEYKDMLGIYGSPVHKTTNLALKFEGFIHSTENGSIYATPPGNIRLNGEHVPLKNTFKPNLTEKWPHSFKSWIIPSLFGLNGFNKHSASQNSTAFIPSKDSQSHVPQTLHAFLHLSHLTQFWGKEPPNEKCFLLTFRPYNAMEQSSVSPVKYDGFNFRSTELINNYNQNNENNETHPHNNTLNGNLEEGVNIVMSAKLYANHISQLFDRPIDISGKNFQHPEKNCKNMDANKLTPKREKVSLSKQDLIKNDSNTETKNGRILRSFKRKKMDFDQNNLHSLSFDADEDEQQLINEEKRLKINHNIKDFAPNGATPENHIKTESAEYILKTPSKRILRSNKLSFSIEDTSAHDLNQDNNPFIQPNANNNYIRRLTQDDSWIAQQLAILKDCLKAHFICDKTVSLMHNQNQNCKLPMPFPAYMYPMPNDANQIFLRTMQMGSKTKSTNSSPLKMIWNESFNCFLLNNTKIKFSSSPSKENSNCFIKHNAVNDEKGNFDVKKSGPKNQHQNVTASNNVTNKRNNGLWLKRKLDINRDTKCDTARVAKSPKAPLCSLNSLEKDIGKNETKRPRRGSLTNGLNNAVNTTNNNKAIAKAREQAQLKYDWIVEEQSLMDSGIVSKRFLHTRLIYPPILGSDLLRCLQPSEKNLPSCEDEKPIFSHASSTPCCHEIKVECSSFGDTPSSAKKIKLSGKSNRLKHTPIQHDKNSISPKIITSNMVNNIMIKETSSTSKLKKPILSPNETQENLLSFPRHANSYIHLQTNLFSDTDSNSNPVFIDDEQCGEFYYKMGKIDKNVTNKSANLEGTYGRCPWCYVLCIDAYALLKHCQLTHDKFTFVLDITSDALLIYIGVNNNASNQTLTSTNPNDTSKLDQEKGTNYMQGQLWCRYRPKRFRYRSGKYYSGIYEMFNHQHISSHNTGIKNLTNFTDRIQSANPINNLNNHNDLNTQTIPEPSKDQIQKLRCRKSNRNSNDSSSLLMNTPMISIPNSNMPENSQEQNQYTIFHTNHNYGQRNLYEFLDPKIAKPLVRAFGKRQTAQAPFFINHKMHLDVNDPNFNNIHNSNNPSNMFNTKHLTNNSTTTYKQFGSNNNNAYNKMNHGYNSNMDWSIVKKMHKRTYYRSSTYQPMLDQDFEYDSECEAFPTWLIEHRCRLIDEFTDVDEDEKAFMKLWNRFMMSPRGVIYLGNCHIYTACQTFINLYTRDVCALNLSKNLIFHLTQMYHFELIDSKQHLELWLLFCQKQAKSGIYENEI